MSQTRQVFRGCLLFKQLLDFSLKVSIIFAPHKPIVPQVRVTADHGLEVRGVGAEDGGQYTCQLDVWGHTQTAVHNLTVLGMFIPFLDI